MNHMVSFGTYATLPVVDVRRFFCLPFLCLKPIRYCQIFPTGNMDKQGNREETDRTMNGTFEAYKTVAFDIIREQLADLANSAEAREMARGLVPCMEEGELRRSMRDTTQARQMLELAGTPPMPAMEHTAEFVARSVRVCAPNIFGKNSQHFWQNILGKREPEIVLFKLPFLSLILRILL